MLSTNIDPSVWFVAPILLLILGFMVYQAIKCKGMTGMLLGGPVKADYGRVQSWARGGTLRVVLADVRGRAIVGLGVSERGIASYQSTAVPLTASEARALAAVLRSMVDELDSAAATDVE